MNEGFIKIHRKIIKEWEWYSNTNDTRLWIHCLLKANWKDGYFEGINVKRGSFATSYQSLSEETGLTIQQIRTSLNHLKKFKNLTITRHSKFSIISIVNYSKYQDVQQSNNNQITISQQSDNNQLTTIEEYKEEKERKNNNIYVEEFDKLWNFYPRKEGKAKSMEKYIKYRKEGISYETIFNGLNNYNNYIKTKGIERQYIKQGSTWFNQKCWEDEYEDVKNGEPSIKQVGEGVFQF